MTIKTIRGFRAPCLVLLVAALTAGAAAGFGDTDLVRAMWVWGSDEVLDPVRQNRLLEFARERRINRLYVSAWSALEKEPSGLAGFIKSSRSRGIDVELLFGEREWALSENHDRVLTIVERVIRFAEQYPDARPRALHLDIEPYNLPIWDADRNRVGRDLVDLFERVRARLDGTGLSLWVDIPIWFEKHQIDRGGTSRPLHELIIDAVDGVTLMDYRDSYRRIVKDAGNELQYASRQQKSVIVGVETLCIEPTSITFCEEGSEAMENILEQLDRDMAQRYSAYRGHAIHHFDSYRELQP